MKIRAMLAGLAVASWVSAAAPAGAEVQLKIENGAVWLTATDATVREILAEWARVGQTRIVNGEKVPGGPVTIELTNVPEERALDDPPRRERLHGGAAADRHRQRVALRSHPCPADEQRAPEHAAGPDAAGPAPAFQPQQPAFAPPQFPPGMPIPAGNDDQDGAPPPRAGCRTRATRSSTGSRSFRRRSSSSSSSSSRPRLRPRPHSRSALRDAAGLSACRFRG